MGFFAVFTSKPDTKKTFFQANLVWNFCWLLTSAIFTIIQYATDTHPIRWGLASAEKLASVWTFVNIDGAWGIIMGFHALLAFICMVYDILTLRDPVYEAIQEENPFEAAAKSTGYGTTEAPKKLEAPDISFKNWFTLATFNWVTDIVEKGYRGNVTMEDLHDILPDDTSNEGWVRVRHALKAELAKPNPSIFRAFVRIYWKNYFLVASWRAAKLTSNLLSAVIFLPLILNFVKDKNSDLVDGLYLPFAMAGCSFLTVLSHHQYFYHAFRMGLRLRASFLMMAYEKSLKLKNAGASSGEIITMVSNDCQRLIDFCLFSHTVWATPVEVTILITLLLVKLEESALPGLALLLIYFPFQAFLGKRITNLRRETLQATDRRVGLMNEILKAIKLIKFYVWEKNFAKLVADYRQAEIHWLEKLAFMKNINFTGGFGIPVAAAVISFSTYAGTGNQMDATTCFTALALFALLRVPLTTFPEGIKFSAEGMVACRRLQSILQLPEINDYNDPALVFSPRSDDQPNPTDFVRIKIANGFFKWDADSINTSNINTHVRKSLRTSQRGEHEVEQSVNDAGITLKNINLDIFAPQIVAVVGSVGSGKSSLISAILRGITKVGGKVGVKGSVAYVPQQAWILNTTLRENILFGLPFDESKYQKVIKACSLSHDLKILPGGDLTEIGERGVNLSGGQKQRVSLARALYSDKEIYLLDDPLSAVDAHVGQHIFYNCIKKYMKHKLVVLVTHQLQYLADCNYVLVMRNGKIVEEGNYQALLNSGQEFSLLLNTFLENKQEDEKESTTKQAVAGAPVEGEENSTESYTIKDPIPDSVSELQELEKEREKEQKEREKNNIVLRSSGQSWSHDLVSPNTLVETQKAEQGGSEDPNKKDEVVKKGIETLKDNVENVEKASESKNVEEGKTKNNEIADEETGIRKQGGKEVKLVQKEEKGVGVISLEVYKAYAKEMGGVGVGLGIILLYAMGQGFRVTIDSWFSIWINAAADNPNIDTTFYILIYNLFFLLCTAVLVIQEVIFYRCCLTAATKLHNKVFVSIVNTRMSFFDTTPLGRLLNRFSSDMDQVDDALPDSMNQAIFFCIQVTCTLLLIIILFPSFIIVAIPLSYFYLKLQNYFRFSSRELKRIESLTRSPIYSHLSESLAGLSSVRAYEVETTFQNKIAAMTDVNSKVAWAFNNTNRWLGFRLDILSTGVIFATALLSVCFKNSSNIDPSLIGLALTYVLQLTGLFQWAVRVAVDTESKMISVERLAHYIHHLDPEETQQVRSRYLPFITQEWPTSGQIEFQNFCFGYREGLPNVLNHVSFKVHNGEKIGIVGRTGAGKSSLATVLFRIAEAREGRILIDDVDIASIPLEILRGAISIIPQDPVLFVGTIRSNLDPFSVCTDEQIWTALKNVYMFDYISSQPEKLNFAISENGENLSVGQRQLICIGRVLLRRSRIIIVDEATAAVDIETDALIQRTIRENFVSCTVLTVAHRLNTIIDYDRVLVLEKGNVVEFDSPVNLLEGRSGAGYFHHLVQQTGEKNASYLLKAARKEIKIFS